jgi:hypothetical protein
MQFSSFLTVVGTIKKALHPFSNEGLWVRKQIKVSNSVQGLQKNGVLAYQSRQQQVQAWHTPLIIKVSLEFILFL